MTKKNIKSKRYQQSLELFDCNKEYNLVDGLNIICNDFKNTNFNETVELTVQLDKKYLKNNPLVKGSTKLPYNIGKNKNIIVFTEDKETAISSGAIDAGLEDLIEKIKEKKINFDCVLSTTFGFDFARKVADILGPKNLMPSKKNETITDKINEAIKEIQNGKIDYKMDKFGNIALGIGKVTMGTDKLLNNLKNVINDIKQRTKNNIIKKVYVSRSMSPGVKIDIKYIDKS